MSAYSITSRGLAGRKIPQGTLTPMGALLFSASEQGAWYDPSDLSTLFQDAAGTTPVTAVEQPVGRMLDKSGRGNHATQATTTKRPVYSRLVNLLTNTETPTSPFTGVVIAASGGFSILKESTASGIHGLTQTVSVVTGVEYVISCRAKRGEGTRNLTLNIAGGAPGAIYNFDSGVSVVSGAAISKSSKMELQPDGDFYCELRFVSSNTYATSVRVLMARNEITNNTNDSYVGDGTSSILIKQIDFRLATGASLPYQRVNTATDYDADPAKFPAYLRLDGVDDSHASATGGGGTSGFFFSAAVTPQGGAGTARTLFSDAGTNTGYIVRLNASNQLELSAGNGTAYTTIATVGTLTVGASAVVQAWDDGVNLNVKIGNGATASIARPVVSAGTAGYTMGQDNGASNGYFNGRIHSTIYRKDSGLKQVQREAVALYQRQKARMP